MIYPRKLKPRILNQLNSDLVLVITGMRRVGKTFLMQDIFQQITGRNKLFLDLEKPENRRVFEKDNYQATIRNLEFLGLQLFPRQPGEEINLKQRVWIFIDEIQNLRFLPQMVKYMVDHYQIKFVVSGSSSFYLKNLFSESLSGRKLILKLSPLDFGEYLIFKQAYSGQFYDNFADLWNLNTEMITTQYLPLFEEYLSVGGFPQVVLEPDESQRKRLWLDILDSYLSIDVRALSDLRGISELEKLIKVLPARMGSKVDVTKLSREVGVSRQTMNNYLEFLEKTFIIDLVSPFSKSADREIVGAKKVYLEDCGLASVIGNFSEGQRFENYVFNSLVDRYPMNYYQRKTGAEIDFVLDKQIGIEAKLFADAGDYQRLQKLAKRLGLSQYWVVSQKVTNTGSRQILPGLLLGFLTQP
jgi:hypothetical protein